MTRVPEASDSVIADAKRAIDTLNLTRHRLIEEVDSAVHADLQQSGTAPLATESPGMVFDRLSVLVIRIARTAEKARSVPDGADGYAGRLPSLRRQLAALSAALESLLRDVRGGTRRFLPYEHLKLYTPAEPGDLAEAVELIAPPVEPEEDPVRPTASAWANPREEDASGAVERHSSGVEDRGGARDPFFLQRRAAFRGRRRRRLRFPMRRRQEAARRPRHVRRRDRARRSRRHGGSPSRSRRRPACWRCPLPTAAGRPRPTTAARKPTSTCQRGREDPPPLDRHERHRSGTTERHQRLAPRRRGRRGRSPRRSSRRPGRSRTVHSSVVASIGAETSTPPAPSERGREPTRRVPATNGPLDVGSEERRHRRLHLTERPRPDEIGASEARARSPRWFSTSTRSQLGQVEDGVDVEVVLGRLVLVGEERPAKDRNGAAAACRRRRCCDPGCSSRPGRRGPRPGRFPWAGSSARRSRQPRRSRDVGRRPSSRWSQELPQEGERPVGCGPAQARRTRRAQSRLGPKSRRLTRSL